jgi:hypothetical protein
MAETESRARPKTGHIKDARGRKVSQLDPVAMHLLRQNHMIAPEDLRRLAVELDAREVKRRPLAVLLAPILVVVWYSLFFGYFYFFSRWRGWDPVLIGFATFYFLFPFARVYYAFRKARRARWARICDVMLRHLHCPHCGYNIRGLLPDPVDSATLCPECGCAWQLDGAAVNHCAQDHGTQSAQ